MSSDRAHSVPNQPPSQRSTPTLDDALPRNGEEGVKLRKKLNDARKQIQDLTNAFKYAHENSLETQQELETENAAFKEENTKLRAQLVEARSEAQARAETQADNEQLKAEIAQLRKQMQRQQSEAQSDLLHAEDEIAQLLQQKRWLQRILEGVRSRYVEGPARFRGEAGDIGEQVIERTVEGVRSEEGDHNDAEYHEEYEHEDDRIPDATESISDMGTPPPLTPTASVSASSPNSSALASASASPDHISPRRPPPQGPSTRDTATPTLTDDTTKDSTHTQSDSFSDSSSEDEGPIAPPIGTGAIDLANILPSRRREKRSASEGRVLKLRSGTELELKGEE